MSALITTKRISKSSATISNKRTAILLYGYVRTISVTSQTLLKHLAEYNDADIFYFGPACTDVPGLDHSGILDSRGFIKINPKNTTKIKDNINIPDLLTKCYGSRLKSFSMHTKSSHDFAEQLRFIDRNEWLFKLDPSRFISMFYNMQGAYHVMKEYEEKTGTVYDNVILTRPDLSFYQPIDAKKIKHGVVYIPSGVGICKLGGYKQVGISEVLFYVNREKGTCIERGNNFNDQVLAFDRSIASSLNKLVDECVEYIKDRVPLTPETILYYHFNVINGFAIKQCPSWFYEIVRHGDSKISNVTELMAMDLIDPYHPNVQKRSKIRPIKYFVKRHWYQFKKIRDWCISRWR
ncbi:hypothetical protein SAMN05880558_102126 [Aeromonas sp. RU39B]|uniref:hypothetical protein n=1 Tax=Aeromonas sp. RU39B TaxID=1907416 RepID=UPI000956302F|nr:hypothetical protein [Aeromonas sp. RU39B]SIQ13951.1 hypothetical protein SAMN05880558_102126 [Aeromonas sp. RU39B]